VVETIILYYDEQKHISHFCRERKIPSIQNGKSKAVPLHAMEVLVGEEV
jgi:hypothetical protein